LVETLYVDGTHAVLGRIASLIAKEAMIGKKIVLLNCDKIVMTGQVENTLRDYIDQMKTIKGRHKGPFWPRHADTIVRRSIRGMIPHKKASGAEIFKRIEVYVGIPKEYANAKLHVFDKAKMKESTSRFMTVGKLAEMISRR
jgi:large subunit ribosomal protein L13